MNTTGLRSVLCIKQTVVMSGLFRDYTRSEVDEVTVMSVM